MRKTLHYLWATLLLAGPLSLYCQPDSLQWTPEFSMRFKSINSVTLSPGGKYVAYVVRTPVMEGEKSEYLQQIWVAATDGEMEVEYTKAEKSSFAPAFSPDGKFLAFLSGRSGKNQLWVMRLLGGEAEQVTDFEKGVGRFQWAPDGESIALLSSDPDTEEEEKAKKEKRDVIVVDQNFKYNHLYRIPFTVDENGERQVRRLTRGDFNITSFDWSPDGKEIAFGFATDPKINTNFIEGDISIVPADSGTVRQLVSRPGPDRNPRYSPDGKTIAFESAGGKPEPIGLADLYAIDNATGEISALPHTPDRSASLWGWTNDGKHLLAFEAMHTVRGMLKVPLDPAGSPVTVTPGKGVSSSVDYDPKSGKLAYVYQLPEKPAEVYVSQPEGVLTPRQVSNQHADIELPPMGRTEIITWTSNDGTEIEGLVTYPVNYKEGEKYPVILQIHGGPAGVFSQTFTGGPSIYLTQYFAEQGFVVIRPNPRGSTGYGRDFRYANFKDWGYGDYEDVMSGVDKILEIGLGDEKRMAVMGWSYGGYLTSFLVTRTGRFQAASMGAGLPNLVSMVTTTDIPDYLVGHMGNEFWNDYDTFEKHSAMYRIKNVTTPTQVIHGANDLRVPFTQGQEFYVALKRLGISTEMLVLPRTPHGPREPKLLMEVSPRILKWFDKHINIKP